MRLGQIYPICMCKIRAFFEEFLEQGLKHTRSHQSKRWSSSIVIIATRPLLHVPISVRFPPYQF